LGGPVGVTRLAPRFIAQFANNAAVAGGSDAGRTQVIAQQPVQRGSFSFSHTGPTGIVILLHRAGRARPFKVVPDVGGGDSTHHALDPVAIPIIHKRGRGRPADRGHAVLSVIRVIGAPRAHHSSIILRPRFPAATFFYLLTFKTVSCFKYLLHGVPFGFTICKHS